GPSGPPGTPPGVPGGPPPATSGPRSSPLGDPPAVRPRAEPLTCETPLGHGDLGRPRVGEGPGAVERAPAVGEPGVRGELQAAPEPIARVQVPPPERLALGDGVPVHRPRR